MKISGNRVSLLIEIVLCVLGSAIAGAVDLWFFDFGLSVWQLSALATVLGIAVRVALYERLMHVYMVLVLPLPSEAGHHEVARQTIRLLTWVMRSVLGTIVCSLFPVSIALLTLWVGNRISAPVDLWTVAGALGVAALLGCGLACKLGYYAWDE